MKAIVDVPASSGQIGVTIRERKYGDEGALYVKYPRSTPKVFGSVRLQLCEQSKLLALHDHAALDKKGVIDAYTHDLALLKRHIEEFEACIRRAIYYSILKGKNTYGKYEDADKETASTWTSLKEQIPPLAQAPLLELPATRAAKESAVLLQELKEEFGLGVERVLALLALWLQLLAERQFVGLIEWTAEDVCRYHYFRYQQIAEVVDIQNRQEITADPSKDYGQRVTYTGIQDKTVRQRMFQERHVHHVALADHCTVREYTDRVPERVRDFVRSIPEWLVGEIGVASGTITQEEIIRLNVEDQTTVESTAVSVSKGSPAVTLGEFALIGWNTDDVAKEPSVFLNTVRRAPVPLKKRAASLVWVALGFCRRYARYALPAVLAVTITGTIALVVAAAIRDSNKAEMARYATYTVDATAFGQSVLVTQKGAVLQLPEMGVQLRYTGLNKLNGWDSVVLSPEEPLFTPQGHRMSAFAFRLQNSAGNTRYGTIDLGPETGTLVRLDVLFVDPNQMKYVATSYKK